MTLNEKSIVTQEVDDLPDEPTEQDVTTDKLKKTLACTWGKSADKVVKLKVEKKLPPSKED